MRQQTSCLPIFDAFDCRAPCIAEHMAMTINVRVGLLAIIGGAERRLMRQSP